MSGEAAVHRDAIGAAHNAQTEVEKLCRELIRNGKGKLAAELLGIAEQLILTLDVYRQEIAAAIPPRASEPSALMPPPRIPQAQEPPIPPGRMIRGVKSARR